MIYQKRGVCVITGVGPGNGRAISAKFASEGFSVAMLARRAEPIEAFAAEIEGASAYPTDVTDVDALRQTLAKIQAELGPISVFVHNAGSGHFKKFMDIEVEDLHNAIATNTQALLVGGQIAAKDMLDAGHGSIVVIGATASMRGGIPTGTFAAAKASQRSMAQTMAKTLGPQGIHVCHVVIDGAIDVPWIRELLPDKPDDFFLKAEAIADTVYAITEQDPSAWTFELDIRPFGESF